MSIRMIKILLIILWFFLTFLFIKFLTLTPEAWRSCEILFHNIIVIFTTVLVIVGQIISTVSVATIVFYKKIK